MYILILSEPVLYSAFLLIPYSTMSAVYLHPQDHHPNLITVSDCKNVRYIHGAGLNDGLFSETMDFRDFPSVLSAVRIAQS